MKRQSVIDHRNTVFKQFYVHSNQFVIGGYNACASISFMAAYMMTFCSTVDEVLNKINWEDDVLGIGKMLWDGWKDKPSSRKQDTRQSLSDIISIPGMERFLPRMGPRTEVCGPAFNISSEEYQMLISAWLSPEMTEDMIRDSIVVRLGEALTKMKTIAGEERHSTAVIFYGAVTISAFADIHNFVIYDSHGFGSPSGKSSLFLCHSISHAKGIIRTIFNCAKPSPPMENYYNMCIFSSPFYYKQEVW